MLLVSASILSGKQLELAGATMVEAITHVPKKKKGERKKADTENNETPMQYSQVKTHIVQRLHLNQVCGIINAG